jgi:cytoskeletal protein CcmA (bactofilin family)
MASDSDIESLIGENTVFEGNLKATGAVRVLGSLQGEIESKGAVYVEERATVSARVTAAQVIVAGKIDGQISCTGKVEIRPTGRVTGEIQAGALIIQEGAFFDGNSKMNSGNNKGGGAS